MLSAATEHYTMEQWIVLEEQISRLIKKRSEDNQRLQFRIAQTLTELLKAEVQSQPEDTKSMEESILLSRQITSCHKTMKDIEREIDHQVKLRSKLLGDPRVQLIRKKQDTIEKMELALEDFMFCNERSLKRGCQLIEKKMNEISLLEAQLEAVESRLDVLYANTPLPPECESMQSEMSYDTTISNSA